MRSRLLPLVAALLLLGTACSSIRTIGSPTGDTTLVARFDDVQHLVVGHSVRIGDVAVGTVTSVRLDGYTAVVEMSIANKHDIAEGSVASLSATSLLGENFVRIEPPDDSVDTGAVLADGDEIPTDGADASFEEMTIKLLRLMRNIQVGDVATIIDESHVALAGRGPELNTLIGTVSDVSDHLVTQTDDLLAVLDSVAAFGSGLVDDIDVLGDSIETAAEATGQLAVQRDRIVATVSHILDAANALDREVLIPHRAQLDVILDRLNPIAEMLAGEVDTLVAIVETTLALGRKAPGVPDDNSAARGYGIVATVEVAGTIIDVPGLSGLLGQSSGQAIIAPPLSPTAAVEKILFGSVEGGRQ